MHGVATAEHANPFDAEFVGERERPARFGKSHLALGRNTEVDT
jgi:hypothetical protein